MARWPTQFPKSTPHGKYGYTRRSKKDGRGCGLLGDKYPCIHPGLDLAAAEGSEVYAPEDGVIDTVSRGTYPPWRGYGPGLVVFRGKSGVYHLLAHLYFDSIVPALKPMEWSDYWEDGVLYAQPDRATVKEGQVLGRTSSANHVHWEVRQKSATGAKMNPAVWLKQQIGKLTLPDYTADDAPASSGGAGAGILILLGLYLWSESR